MVCATPSRAFAGMRSRSPSAQRSGDIQPGSANAGIALSGRSLALARLAAGIQEQNRVMHDLRVARTELDLLHILILIGVQRNHEAAELIGAFGRHRIGLGHLEYLIRLAGQPSIGKLRRRGFVRGIALRRAMLRPNR